MSLGDDHRDLRVREKRLLRRKRSEKERKEKKRTTGDELNRVRERVTERLQSSQLRVEKIRSDFCCCSSHFQPPATDVLVVAVSQSVSHSHRPSKAQRGKGTSSSSSTQAVVQLGETGNTHTHTTLTRREDGEERYGRENVWRTLRHRLSVAVQ